MLRSCRSSSSERVEHVAAHRDGVEYQWLRRGGAHRGQLLERRARGDAPPSASARRSCCSRSSLPIRLPSPAARCPRQARLRLPRGLRARRGTCSWASRTSRRALGRAPAPHRRSRRAPGGPQALGGAVLGAFITAGRTVHAMPQVVGDEDSYAVSPRAPLLTTDLQNNAYLCGEERGFWRGAPAWRLLAGRHHRRAFHARARTGQQQQRGRRGRRPAPTAAAGERAATALRFHWAPGPVCDTKESTAARLAARTQSDVCCGL